MQTIRDDDQQVIGFRCGLQLDVPWPLKQSDRAWWLEMEAMYAMGFTRCSNCLNAIEHMRHVTNPDGTDAKGFKLDAELTVVSSIECRRCFSGCVRLRQGGKVTYWDNFDRTPQLYPYIATVAAIPGGPHPLIATAVSNHVLGLKWQGRSYVALYPLGLMVLADSFQELGNSLVNYIGVAMNLTSPIPNLVRLPGVHYRNQWTMIDTQRVRINACVPLETWKAYFCAHLRIDAAELDPYIPSIERGIEVVNIIIDLLERKEYGSNAKAILEMIGNAKAAGMIIRKDFDAEAWKLKVDAALSGFGGASRILRR